MIDLHSHTFFSDGILSPSELVYRAKRIGYSAIGITDHGDFSNMDFIIKRMIKAAKPLQKEYKIMVIPGIELTYIPPRLIGQTIRTARKLGARLVAVHGESPVEPVPPGTNRAAITGRVDFLAHPGFITHDDAELARKHGILLEITARKGHSKANTHVGSAAKRCGARLIFNTDTHVPDNLISADGIEKVLLSAKLSQDDFVVMQDNAAQLIKKITRAGR